MKKFSLIILFTSLLVGQSLMAQDFYISPNPVYKNGVTGADVEGVAYADIYTNSDFDLHLTWEVTAVEMTEGWGVAVCDLVQCYFPTVTTESFTLMVDSVGDMDVHVYPNGIEGSAIIEVEVYETDNPSSTTTGIYYFNHTVGIAEKFSEAIKVYPNPTQDYLTIDNSENLVSSVELYNVSGKMVMNSNLNGNDRISIQELAAGNYILKLVDANANIVSTNLVVKQ